MKQMIREGQRIATAANAIAVALAQDLNTSEENILGNLLTLVGASLLSIAAIDEASSKNGGSSSN